MLLSTIATTHTTRADLRRRTLVIEPSIECTEMGCYNLGGLILQDYVFKGYVIPNALGPTVLCVCFLNEPLGFFILHGRTRFAMMISATRARAVPELSESSLSGFCTWG
ncbi:hypothetical protein BR93DRAFT_192328 [Coniochaeta sp. PMI_546]|nr:hypothetical protein BR93DRAFT_192328 [Coniochaeta sp. PMI_546]